jgi:hypothetical protein
MLNRFLRSSRTCFIATILYAFPAIAAAPTPLQEFWEYMAEYGDDNGDVLDPLEYDQILSMKDSDPTANIDADLADEPVVFAKPKIRNTDMKFGQKSSAQSSSADAKGAKL